VPRLSALAALWVAAWLFCIFPSGARRRYLVHLLYHNLIVHVVVRLDVLQKLLRSVGFHVNQLLCPAERPVSEFRLLVPDVALAVLVSAGAAFAHADDADAVAIAPNTAAGTTDDVASSDDSVASVNDADNDDNCDNESNSSYDPDDEAYDATYDDRNWRELQREADAEVDEQHYYTRQRQGRPDWGIQDPGWHAPRAPTAHPDARPPSNHRLQDWNVNVTKFSDKSGYTILNADIIYRLPSAPGNTVRYHPPFVPGTLERQLHRRPLSERLHVLHQLRDVLLTEEEEIFISERMDPVRESVSLSLNSTDIAVQTERYHESQEHAEYEETLRAALEGDRPRLLVPADTAISTPTLPPLPPFIPFISHLVLRRQSI
jgi:hypothetical protein